MATQHPDNANAPYWDKAGQPFIGAYQEMKEAVACFKDLGVSEFMWDWEGKHADAAVIDRLFSEYYDYFAENQLGRDEFLTFRLPNIWEEKGYSLLQAMTVILTSEDFARDLKYQNRPLFEVILPMTERADQLMHMHELFEKLAQFKSSQFTPDQPANTEYLELIPLVESVESQQAVAELLTKYVELHKQHFGRQPEYIRPFLARSDPALVSGLLSTVIANKLALSRVYEFAEDTGIAVYPISGVGSLPFRGGLTPDTVDSYIAEYPGMRTVSIQSSFRYDHPIEEVKAAVARLESELPNTTPVIISQSDQERLVSIAAQSTGFYQDALSAIAPDLQPIFDAVPKRRDRRQHIGLLAYGRSLGEHKMPRAITFTAGFYSIGIPPELIGLGRSLKALSTDDLDLIKQQYSNLVSDAQSAGKFFSQENLVALAAKNEAWKQVQEDIGAAHDILGIEFGPETEDQKKHAELSAKALTLTESPDELKALINEMAILRKSLG
ncbi:MAG: phosphoenolpyruvate carboxylase [Patescibacteria group bacterium]